MACNGTCWAACGSSCSSSASRSGVGSHRANSSGYDRGHISAPEGCSYRNVTAEGGRASGCWCGSDCAGCGGGCTGTSKVSGCSDCSGGCSGGCGGSCSGSCVGDCKGKCAGTCNTGCQEGCKNKCTGYCDTQCTNQCGHLCNSSCATNVAIKAYEHLKTYKEKIDDSKYVYDIQEDWMDEDFVKNHISHLDENKAALDWLDRVEINYLLNLIQEEGRRRKLQKKGTFNGGNHPITNIYREPTQEENLSTDEKIQIGILNEQQQSMEINSGDFVTDRGKTITVKNLQTQENDDYKVAIGIKELNSLLLKNAGKQIDISSTQAGIGQNQTIKKKAGEAFIEKALEAWKEQVGIPTTSDSRGTLTDA